MQTRTSLKALGYCRNVIVSSCGWRIEAALAPSAIFMLHPRVSSAGGGPSRVLGANA